MSLAKVILILKQSVRLSKVRVLCAVQSTAHNTCAILAHAAMPLYNKLQHNLTECFNINIILARPNCKLSDDGRRRKHVEAI